MSYGRIQATKLNEQVPGDFRPWQVERVTLNRESVAIELELICFYFLRY